MFFFYCKQKTAYEMRISDWSSDVCSSVLTLGLQALVAGPTALALGHPLGGEAAVLDLVEDLAHLRLHGRVDDPRAAGEVAVLGGVGDGVPHAGDALLVHEVDDELQLVEALEVGRLGLVASLDEGLEASLHEGGEAAAEHHLLAE